MNIRSRALPSGGSAILQAWRSMHGPEAQRTQALAMRGGSWSAGSGQAVQMLAGNGMRSMRSYMAASNDRLAGDLAGMLSDLSGNAEVRGALRIMRRKSRQLANDNEYVKRFLQLLRDNVVGAHGFAFQSKIYKSRRNKQGVRELDRDANDAIELFYEKQSKLGAFTACGKLTRATFERAAITALARDGEIIVEKLMGARFGPYGIAWRLIDSDLLDDALNIGRGGGMQGMTPGNEIRMGVELDPYGKPEAYWFLQGHPGDDLAGMQVQRHRRVPADRIIHRFLVEDTRPGTSRGVPWLFVAIRRMSMLGGYEEAALVNARTGASKMGWYVPPAPAGGGGALNETGQSGEAVADGEDAEGNLITEAEPGTFGTLPAGWDFKTWDPAYPNDAMGGFVKGMLRAFSSGVGLTYNTIANDLEGVSLSAMRHGANQDRDTYEAIQSWFRDHISVPMFEPALQLALQLGRIGTLPPDAFERLNHPRFIARPFRSPDPQKDRAAGAQGVALGTTSRTRLCAEEGSDFEEVLEELAHEEAMAKAKGVALNTQAATAHKNPAVDTAGNTPTAGEDDDAPAGNKPEGEDDDAAGK